MQLNTKPSLDRYRLLIPSEDMGRSQAPTPHSATGAQKRREASVELKRKAEELTLSSGQVIMSSRNQRSHLAQLLAFRSAPG